MNFHLLEEAALNAWPTVHQMLYDGWVLRFANGYTKRANSINPLYAGVLDLYEKIDYCEKIYTAQNLPPIFRLIAPFVPPGLDVMLAARGYDRMDPTTVMTLDLRAWQEKAASTNEVRVLPLNDWLSLYTQMSGAALQNEALHREILKAILAPRLMAVLHHQGQPVSCGLGVLQGGYLGLFDIFTAANSRRQGFAAELVSAMLLWAQRQGVSQAYLQVMENNRPARQLYTKLGFERVYDYWYRVPQTGPAQ